jgi:hypothetical protein
MGGAALGIEVSTTISIVLKRLDQENVSIKSK